MTSCVSGLSTWSCFYCFLFCTGLDLSCNPLLAVFSFYMNGSRRLHKISMVIDINPISVMKLMLFTLYKFVCSAHIACSGAVITQCV